MLTLHHLEYSQSFRILWLLEALDAEYELVRYRRQPVSMLAPRALKSLSPLGSAPVITDGELVLAESSAIMEYILDKYPKSSLRPKTGSRFRTRYLFWFHAAQGTMMPVLLVDTLFLLMRKRAPLPLKPLLGAMGQMIKLVFVKPRLDGLLRLAEEDLSKSTWFAGPKLSAADIVLSYSMLAARERGFINDNHPNCLRWLEQIETEPSFVKALEQDGRGRVVMPFK
ncbi:MAG: glutathione S-transferase [Pseudomonadota bacterium]